MSLSPQKKEKISPNKKKSWACVFLLSEKARKENAGKIL